MSNPTPVHGAEPTGGIAERTSEAWKAFGGDTEAGRLLKRLYCGHAKPKVSYPKLKTKRREALPASPFIPGGGVVGVDSRTQHLAARTSQRAIKAPAFSKSKGGTPEMHPIDCLGTRKKPIGEIEKEVNAIKRQMEAYRLTCIKRPPNQEKEKLQQVFSYTAGSILPRELLPGADLLDRELSHTNALRTTKSTQDRLAQLEGLYDAVLGEVEERKNYISEMIALGRPERAETVEREILERMTELKKLHQLILKEKSKRQSNNNSSSDD